MCSYCGCENIEVIGRFMGEHEGLINASGQLRRACDTGDLARIEDCIDTLTALLVPHTSAEEGGLFAVLAEDPEFTDTVHGLCAEHERIDALLAAVRTADSASRRTAYDAFEHLLRRHIDHEDNGLFPAAAIRFAGPEWDRVAALTPSA